MQSLAELSSRTDTLLAQLFESPQDFGIDQPVSQRVWDAMAYSTLNGGKRVRASLSYASGIALGATIEKTDNVALALECIHAYSLIHDDLPAMDDDDLRRGKPSCHKQFDDATAILAGDALQALAFTLINSPSNLLSDSQARRISYHLGDASGHNGMVGGQMLDVQESDAEANAELVCDSDTDKRALLEKIHKNKTGALIKSATLCGAFCFDQVTEQQIQALGVYADSIGLAFQVVDDILDVESTTEQLGKISGADQAMGKLTYPALLGLEESKTLANNLFQQAIESISTISDNSGLLYDIAEMIIDRKN